MKQKINLQFLEHKLDPNFKMIDIVTSLNATEFD